MSSFDVIEIKLASDVADAGTFTVAYPNFRNAGSYEGGSNHKLVSNKYGDLTQRKGDITLSFGTTNVTITNKTGGVLLALTEFFVEFDRLGDDSASAALANPDTMVNLHTVDINLGAPDTADVNGVFEAISQGAGAITLDGALATGGVVTFDVPRNVVIDAAGADTAKITFVGEDEYGVTMSEKITANGTTAVIGKKAFKKILSASSDATTSNGVFAGPGNILGLPVFLAQAGNVTHEKEDGAVVGTLGTIVAGVLLAATTTTGDVRGTYDPDSSADASKAFSLIVALSERNFKGVDQV